MTTSPSKPVETIARLIAEATTVVECIQRDDCGQMVGQIWMGGNGGLLSNETLQAADRLRNTLAALNTGETE